jgi:hypothetical protein
MLGAFQSVRSVDAAPVGAATGLTTQFQNCQNDGTVQARFLWGPSGLGSQWVDVTVFNNNFAGPFGNNGPLASNVNALDWFGLLPNTTYYVRVNTLASTGFLPSDTMSFTTVSCFSAPSSPTSQALSSGAVRLSWQSGTGNLFYCVDTAFTSDDLTGFKGSFANWGCGTTATTIDLNLLCGTPHYWRVWAAGIGTNGYSPIAQMTTPNCNFTAPSSPTATPLSSTAVRFNWTAGNNNTLFCLDVAKTEDDLKNLTGSWNNYGCGTTATTFDVTGLTCNTKYFWRVWAKGTTESAYTAIADVTTPPDCGFTPASGLTSQVLSPTSLKLTWTAGSDNKFYCVDMATSAEDLTQFKGSWFNRGCGQTATTIDVTGLTCATTYFWRVYAQGTNIAGHSVMVQATTSACPTS